MGKLAIEGKRDAERFLQALGERLGQFDLALHPTKTRLVEFGRFAEADRRARGLGRPETFDFLGFTHYCTKTGSGRFGLGRKPAAKRMSRTLKRIAEGLRRRRHHDLHEVARWLGRVVNGWLNYYAVPTSARFLRSFTYILNGYGGRRCADGRNGIASAGNGCKPWSTDTGPSRGSDTRGRNSGSTSNTRGRSRMV